MVENNTLAVIFAHVKAAMCVVVETHHCAFHPHPPSAGAGEGVYAAHCATKKRLCSAVYASRGSLCVRGG